MPVSNSESSCRRSANAIASPPGGFILKTNDRDVYTAANTHGDLFAASDFSTFNATAGKAYSPAGPRPPRQSPLQLTDIRSTFRSTIACGTATYGDLPAKRWYNITISEDIGCFSSQEK
ncbi:hypothetical protein C1H76_2678 [Elsinoe australis]|uniref:Uncharacterized protein n=1 Tax=Elsinoe australis TaxID=40998 RepID=A0A4V6DVS5_9PEZI|nr:hypothetical protein C1H76_2678 [Elsinoe australis]